MNPQSITFGGMSCVGDQVCLVSAAHTFARTTGRKVYINSCPDLIAAYEDGVLAYGDEGYRCEITPRLIHYHSEKHGHLDDYLQTYLSLMVPDYKRYRFELPAFPAERPLCLIQPNGKTARNADDSYIQALVDAFRAETGYDVYGVGNAATRRDLQNVKWDLLGDSIPALMGHIRSARYVLTCRSASCHIAAGYGVPGFVWTPDEKDNWHIGYAWWDSKVVLIDEGAEFAINAMREHMAKVGI